MSSTKSIYLDYAAATPIDPRVLKVMQPFYIEKFYNPSSNYLKAKEVKQELEKARKIIANIIGVKVNEIIFTAGGTEANNLAIKGVMDKWPENNLVISEIEHEATLEPSKNYNHKLAQVNEEGLIKLNDLEKKIDDKTVLVSIIYANNEIGTIQPIKEISKLINKIKLHRINQNNKLPLIFHIDACQAPGQVDIHPKQLGVDMMTINGGKIYGPKQSGFLYIKTGIQINPLIEGGGQEHGLRSGTEQVANIIGLAKALELVLTDKEQERKRLANLQNIFIDQLLNKVNDVKINGSTRHRLANNINAIFKGQDNEKLMMKLDEAGIMCSTGSACNANNDELSHVLTAIGLNSTEIKSTLRFTIGKHTTSNDITKTVETLAKCID